MDVKTERIEKRCVIVGGAPISDYSRVRSYLRDDDYLIYCDSGLRHMDGLGRAPSLIVADFDSHEDPHLDVETIVLPVAKDDTDTVHAVRVGIERGFTDFLLAGVFGARLDHSLVNVYALYDLDTRGCNAMAVDDYSEITVLSPGSCNIYNMKRADQPAAACSARADIHGDDSDDGREMPGRPGRAYVDDSYSYFSLLNMTGTARGVTIRNAKFPLEDGEITSDYQYATSNEVLPGKTAEIAICEGRLLLIKDI